MITNLTIHEATPTQIRVGVIDLEGENLKTLKGLLDFRELPSTTDLYARAQKVAALIPEGVEVAMIGGAPFFMAPLERALHARDITCLYAFSVRESVEAVQADGSILKTAVFRHRGFVGW